MALANIGLRIAERVMDWGLVERGLAAVANLPWSEFKTAILLLFGFLALIAVFGCLHKLGTIREIIREFNQARGPIWDLRETVNQLDGLSPVIQQMNEQIQRLEATVLATRKQMAEWQIESASERTEAQPVDQHQAEDATAVAESAPLQPTEAQNQQDNWDKLRGYWRRNTERLEYIVDQIGDGRTRLAFDRLPRTNYNKIINRLEARKLISTAAAHASRELNALFNAYKPRNSVVRSEMLGPLQVLDAQLDKELVSYAKVQQATDLDDSAETTVAPNGADAATSPPSAIAPAVTRNRNGRQAPSNLPEDRVH